MLMERVEDRSALSSREEEASLTDRFAKGTVQPMQSLMRHTVAQSTLHSTLITSLSGSPPRPGGAWSGSARVTRFDSMCLTPGVLMIDVLSPDLWHDRTMLYTSFISW